MLPVLGLLACASTGPHGALGWSLGGEAHVFVAGNDFARDYYRQLTGKRSLIDALEGRPVVVVEGHGGPATVLSANGAAPARLSLARFHAPQTCGYPGLVTELVLAFPPGGAAGSSAPASHESVVALLDAPPFAGGAGTPVAALSILDAMTLIRRVADQAEHATRGPLMGLLHPLTLDPDQAIDAGEVVPLRSQYAVGFRASFVRTTGESTIDTTLITGVAVTDPDMRGLRWVVRPIRLHLVRGVIARPNAGGRYSLRGAVTGSGGSALLLVDRIADVSPRDSRALAVDVATRRVVATQPLALRCP